MSKDTPYAGGRWTLDRYRQFVVSALRKAWMKYPVKADVLKAASRPATAEAKSRNPRVKSEYRCAICGNWFFGNEVQVDHIRECAADDMNQFIATLFCEEDNLRVLCKGCHRVKTQEDRKRRKSA